jgi:hypothetical protein
MGREDRDGGDAKDQPHNERASGVEVMVLGVVAPTIKP